MLNDSSAKCPCASKGLSPVDDGRDNGHTVHSCTRDVARTAETIDQLRSPSAKGGGTTTKRKRQKLGMSLFTSFAPTRRNRSSLHSEESGNSDSKYAEVFPFSTMTMIHPTNVSSRRRCWIVTDFGFLLVRCRPAARLLLSRLVQCRRLAALRPRRVPSARFRFFK